jgi:hypothetical protein
VANPKQEIMTGKGRLVLLCFVVFLIGGYLISACYLRYKSKQYDASFNSIALSDTLASFVTQEQLLNLGWIPKNDSDRYSFINYLNDRDDSVKLIGIFGDSFIEGNEVDYQYNIVAFLNKLYLENGRADIRAVNFGRGGYGQHQSFLLWQYFGKRLHLYKTIFNPHSMHIERDMSFTLYFLYKPVHARYILDGDSLKLISVSGKNREEAAEKYHSFFSPYKYWQYDYKVPTLMKPLSFLKANPFYYVPKDSAISEILLTYRKLFQTVNNNSEDFRLLMGNEPNEKWFDSAFVDFKRTDFNLPENLSQTNRTLYFAPNGHLSSMGNHIQAVRLYNFLENDSFSYSLFNSPQFVLRAEENHPAVMIDSISWLINAEKGGELFSKQSDRYFSGIYRFAESAKSILILRFADEHLFLVPLKTNLDTTTGLILDVNQTPIKAAISKLNGNFYLADLSQCVLDKKDNSSMGILLWRLLEQNYKVHLNLNNDSRLLINDGLALEGGYFRLRAGDFPLSPSIPDSLEISARCYSGKTYRDYPLVKYFKTISGK